MKHSKELKPNANGGKIEELISVRPINEATKKDVAKVNYLIRKNLKTTDAVVKEAIATNNPTIMWMVAKFVNGITDVQENALHLAINNCSESLRYREVSLKNNNNCLHLTPEELKVKKRQDRIEAILNKYIDVSIEELFSLCSVNIYNYKKFVYIINGLLRRGFKTTVEVVEAAISFNNAIMIYIVANFVEGVSEEQKDMLFLALKKIKIEEMINFKPVTMHASKRDVVQINYLLHEGLKTIDEVVEEAVKSKNPLVMYYIALFVDGITARHMELIIDGFNSCKEALDIRVDVVMQNLARKCPDYAGLLSKCVLETGSISGMASFAQNVEEASVKDFGEQILNNSKALEDANTIFMFVRNHLEELDEDYIRRAAKKVIELKNPTAICSFSKFGRLTILEYAIALIEAIGKKQDYAVYLYLFALNNEMAKDFPEFIIDEIIYSNNNDVIYRAARDFKLESSVEKLVKKLGDNLMMGNNKCRDYLANLALSNGLSAFYAVEEIIKLEDPILITYVMQNCKDMELSNRLQEILNSLPCIDGETLNDNGAMEVSLIRSRNNVPEKSIIVES